MMLPPLAGLRAFEAAARRQNFRHAAAELGMTATAVSQHVRALEDWLDVKLFERGARGVRLTDAGRDFGTSVTSALGIIGGAAERIRTGKRRGTVRLACLPSIVTHWLAPRLNEFRSAHPGIAISISYAANARTPQEANADLLIQHGTRPAGTAYVIMHGATRPTCSPAYLTQNGAPSSEHDLVDATLLHDETPLAWQTWLSQGNLPDNQRSGPVYADFGLLLSSVTAGLGIALCPSALITSELAEGKLITLFERSGDKDKFYWLTIKDELGPEGTLMRDWLISQAVPEQR